MTPHRQPKAPFCTLLDFYFSTNKHNEAAVKGIQTLDLLVALQSYLTLLGIPQPFKTFSLFFNLHFQPSRCHRVTYAWGP